MMNTFLLTQILVASLFVNVMCNYSLNAYASIKLVTKSPVSGIMRLVNTVQLLTARITMVFSIISFLLLLPKLTAFGLAVILMLGL